MTPPTPTTRPSAPETTSELREALAPFASAAEWLEGCQTVHISSPDQAGVMRLGIKAFQRAHTALATPTTPPPAGDVAALRALGNEAQRLKEAWHTGRDSSSWAACCAADHAFESAAVVYVRTQILPAQTTTAAAPGSEGGVEDDGSVDRNLETAARAICAAAAHNPLEDYSSFDAYVDDNWRDYIGDAGKVFALARRSAPASGQGGDLREAANRLCNTVGNLNFETMMRLSGADVRNAVRRALDDTRAALARRSAPATAGASEKPEAFFDQDAMLGADAKWRADQEKTGSATGGAARLDREARYFPDDLKDYDLIEWIVGYYGAQIPYAVGTKLLDLASNWRAAITPAGRGADAGGYDGPQRWETGIRNIVSILIGSRNEFTVKEVVERVRDLVNRDNWRPTHRHLKTGGLYQTLDVVTNATNAQNGVPMMLYRGAPDAGGWPGRTFVRAKSEFDDGRFERLDRAAAPTAQGEA